MGKKKVKIKIDYSKCQQPENCNKCLRLCKPGVFHLIFMDKDYHDPKDWKIIPAFPRLCIFNSCNSCVEDCPENAISIK